MNDGPQPLTAVGRDCRCGNPLVWIHGTQRCSVYGEHPQTVKADVEPDGPRSIRYIENAAMAGARRAIAFGRVYEHERRAS